jgi:hypothetical protein
VLTAIEQKIVEKSAQGVAMWKGVDVVIDLFTPVMKLLRKADAEEPCIGFIYSAMESRVHEVEKLELHHAPLQCMKRR